MSKIKFTPGPWFAMDDQYVTSKAFGPVADFKQQGEIERNKANAALIAAAPDMFEALEEMLEILGILRQSGVNVLAIPKAVKVRKKAHKILSKARGES